MKKTTTVLGAVCLMCAAMAYAGDELPPKAHPDSKAWENLFTEDLSNAAFPKGVWTVKDGELTASKDECIWTKKEYENFILDLEFKTAPGSNSGVIIYNSDTKNWIPNSIEIQILDDYADKWQKTAKTWHCAGLFGRLAPAKEGVVKKPGEWNRMTVIGKGTLVYVLLNGELTVAADMKKWTSAKKNPDGSDIPAWLSKPMAELATKGVIGLQGKHGDAPIFFRNVKIKQLD